MRIEKARYELDEGRQLLVVDLDGEEIALHPPEHPLVYDAGLVIVEGPKGATLSAEAVIEGRRVIVPHATRDPVLRALVVEWVRAINDGTFEEGPVPIPDEEEIP